MTINATDTDFTRDNLVYGSDLPDPKWPNGAKLALSGLGAVFKFIKYHISFCSLNYMLGYSTLGWGMARLSVPLQ